MGAFTAADRIIIINTNIIIIDEAFGIREDAFQSSFGNGIRL